MDVASGQIEDRYPTPEEQGKSPAGSSAGAKVGKEAYQKRLAGTAAQANLYM